LPVRVADDEAGVVILLDGPRRREAARGWHERFYHDEDAREDGGQRQNAPSATADSARAFYGLAAFSKRLRQLGEVRRRSQADGCRARRGNKAGVQRDAMAWRLETLRAGYCGQR
jgi:hypothetical protein